MGWTFKARVITGRPLSPSRSHSQSNLPSPDLLSSPGKMKTKNSVGAEESQYRVIPGLIRATELFHSESGFCEGALWGGIGEKMNFLSDRASVENRSLFSVLCPSLPGAGCLCSFWRLILTGLVPTFALACHPSERNKDILPDHRVGRSPALAGSQFVLSQSHFGAYILTSFWAPGFQEES